MGRAGSRIKHAAQRCQSKIPSIATKARCRFSGDAHADRQCWMASLEIFPDPQPIEVETLMLYIPRQCTSKTLCRCWMYLPDWAVSGVTELPGFCGKSTPNNIEPCILKLKETFDLVIYIHISSIKLLCLRLWSTTDVLQHRSSSGLASFLLLLLLWVHC